MSKSIQDSLNLVGRLLLVALFLPAGIGKLTGFAGIGVCCFALLVG